MNTRHRFCLAAVTAGAFLLFLILIPLFIPDSQLQEIAGRIAERQGCTLRAARFGKTFPLGIRAVGLEISNDRGALLKADRASVRLALLPLLTGKVILYYRADIGPGQIKGDFSPRNGEFSIDAKGIHLEDIPFFPSVTGSTVRGELSFACKFNEKGREPTGELRLEVKKAFIAGVKVGEMPLPDADYAVIQGMIRQKGTGFILESFTLQGDGLYVRLKGDFPLATPFGTAPLNLTLELMPKPDFLEKQKFFFLLLTKYLVSPGNYSIPVRGVLTKPLIQ